MPNCPYCSHLFATSTVGPRPRPETFTLLLCDSCNGYFVRHISGNAYPLSDRNDPDADHQQRVVD